MLKLLTAIRRIDTGMFSQVLSYLLRLDFKTVRTLLSVFLMRFSPQPSYRPVLFSGNHAGEKLVFPEGGTPLVSIVIPVYNHYEQTISCLRSLHAAHCDCHYEIIIADDGSSDETRTIQDRVANITLLKNEENLQFLKNCNMAAHHAQGEFLLFLNNDTNVQEGWLDALVNTMAADSSVGIVGAKLVYPDGRLQEAGGIVWRDGSCWNYGWFDDPDKPEYNYPREVDYVSGACLMVRRDLWEEIGGFDEAFAPAYYEDTDLAFQARARGYKVVYQPNAVVAHFEGVSCGINLRQGVKQHQAINKAKFFDKWQPVLLKEHFERGKNLDIACRNRRQKRPT